MKKIIFIIFVSVSLLCSKKIFGQNTQQPIEVADLTLKIGGLGGEEIVWYGFAEGDQIIFSMREKDDKELKEVSIFEYPDISKFQDYKTSLIENKIIRVSKTGIYKFTFHNSALGGRVCKINIKRIPENASTANFNTNVVWQTLSDTTYIPRTRQVLDRIEDDYVTLSEFKNTIYLKSRTNSACLNSPATCTKDKIALSYPSDTEYITMYIVSEQKTAEQFNNLSKGVTKIAVKAGAAYFSQGSSLLINSSINKQIDSQVDNLPLYNSSNYIDIHFTDNAGFTSWYYDANSAVKSYPNMEFKNKIVLHQRFKVGTQVPNNQVIVCFKNNNNVVGVPVYAEIVAERKIPIYRTEEYKDIKVKSTQIPVLERSITATTSDNSVWTSEIKARFYNTFYTDFKKQGIEEEMAKETATCIVEKISAQKTPSEWDNMNDAGRQNLGNEIYAICTEKYQIKKTPEQEKAMTFGNLGWKAFENGDIDKCIEYSKKALTFDNTLGFVKANLGLCHLIKGDESTATDYYVDALSDYKNEKVKPNTKYYLEATIKDIEDALKKYATMKGANYIKELLEMELKNY